MKEKLRNIPVTVSYYSPSGIVFTSNKGAGWYHVTSAVAGSFIFVFSAIILMFPRTENRLVMGGFLVTGLVMLSIPLYMRSRSTEISLLASTRQIVGIPGKRSIVTFSDIDHVKLSMFRNQCSLALETKNSDRVILAENYPLNLTLRLASRIGEMLQVPVRNENGRSVKKPVDMDWTLPYDMPSGRFPLEFLLLAAALAGALAVMVMFRLENIFLFDIAPKWLFLPALVIPSIQLLTNVQYNRGFFHALPIVALFQLFSIGITVWGGYEPATTYLGLIPAAMAVLMVINAYTERKKLRLWIPVCLFCVIPGITYALFVSYHYHTFFRLDPSVVDSIRIARGSDPEHVIDVPNDIYTIVKALQTGGQQRSHDTHRTRILVMSLNRPAGRDYYIHIHRQGVGKQARVVYRLYCSWFTSKLFLGKVSSASAESMLVPLGSLYGIWPPGY